MNRHRVVFRSPLDADIEEDELGEVGPHDVLIETHLTLVSTGTEMTAYTGDFPEGSFWSRVTQYPMSPGYSNVGRVMTVGSDVRNLNPDDIVFSWAPHASHVLMPEDDVTRVPPGIGLRQAVFATLGQIALNGVRLGEISLGDCVVAAGTGPVGQMALQCARLSGACPLIAADLSTERLEVASNHGADFTVDASKKDLVEAISEISKGRMADVVFDVTGNQNFIPQAVKLLKRRGKLVILGSPRGKTEIDFHDQVHYLGLRIIGAHNSVHSPVETPFNQWTHSRDLELFFDLVRNDRMKVDDLITHTYRWQDSPEAYQMLLENRNESICVVFNWKAKE